MGWFIGLAFLAAFVVLLNEICKLGPGGSLAQRLRRALPGRPPPDARRPFDSEVPGLGWPAQPHAPIVWDEPEDTREIWPLSSLADELPESPPPARRPFRALLDDDLDEATFPRRG